MNNIPTIEYHEGQYIVKCFVFGEWHEEVFDFEYEALALLKQLEILHL